MRDRSARGPVHDGPDAAAPAPDAALAVPRAALAVDGGDTDPGGAGRAVEAAHVGHRGAQGQGRRPPQPAIRRLTETVLPTRYGPFALRVYATAAGPEHVALALGPIADGAPVLVRLHSECLTGDVLGSSRCDCGTQLQDSLALLQEQGRGVMLYLRQEGRGIGLANKIRAYALQDQGYDTVEANLLLGLPADARDYAAAAAMLGDLGVRQVRLLTNNPAKVAGLERHGLVVERVALPVRPTAANRHYLLTKQEKMGHLLGLTAPADERRGGSGRADSRDPGAAT